MNCSKIRISPTKLEKDLTIIYKRGEDELHEIKTSKDEFFRTLRYYQQKNNIDRQSNLIYIHEDIQFNEFEKFISSITEKEIEVNENNAAHFLYLSKKYEYKELLEKIEEYIEEHPSLSSIIGQIIDQNSTSQKHTNAKESNEFEKEEIIAKNLDISIQNGILNNLPLENIIRIVNSPNRIIKDHHLLFTFVIQTIQKYQNENLNEKEKINLTFLPSSLNYCDMTSDEIKELFEIEQKAQFFSPKNSKEFILNLISNEKELREKYFELEERMTQMEKNLQTKIESIEETIQNSHKKIKHKKEGAKPIHINKEEIKDEDDKKLFLEVEKEQEDTQFAISMILQQFGKQKSEVSETEEEEDDDEDDEYNANENDEIKEFKFNENDQLGGIIKYLSDQTGGNPHDNHTIEVTSNSICSDSCHPKNLLNSVKEDDYLPKSSDLNAWVCFDFKNMEIEISKYAIKSSDFSKDYGHIKNWVIEISNDAKKWKQIDERSDCNDLNGPNIIKTFEVQPNRFSRYCRFRNTGEYWGIKEKWGIQFNSIEFFGRLKTHHSISE